MSRKEIIRVPIFPFKMVNAYLVKSERGCIVVDTGGLVENAEAMLVLRSAALTGRWEETLEHSRQTLAGDRRLDWQWQSPDMPNDLKSHKVIRPPKPQGQAGQTAGRKAA